MIKVWIEDCGIKLPAEIKIEEDALVVTPNEPIRNDEAGDCEYIVSGWREGDTECNWVGIVKGNIAIYDKCFSYDTVAGAYINFTSPQGETFWVDKNCDSGTYIRVADEDERKYLDEELAKHGLAFDKGKGELVMKEVWPQIGEIYWTICWDFAAINFSHTMFMYQNDKSDKVAIRKGWVFKTEAEAKQKCDDLNAAIKDL